MSSLITKLKSYLSQTPYETKFFPFLVEIDEKKFDFAEEYLFYTFYLNPHFYHINFIPTELEGSENVRVTCKNYEK